MDVNKSKISNFTDKNCRSHRENEAIAQRLVAILLTPLRKIARLWKISTQTPKKLNLPSRRQYSISGHLGANRFTSRFLGSSKTLFFNIGNSANPPASGTLNIWKTEAHFCCQFNGQIFQKTGLILIVISMRSHSLCCHTTEQ